MNTNEAVPTANEGDAEMTLLAAIESYSSTLVSLSGEIADLWPDVQRLVTEAREASDHPEARLLYEAISERQNAVVTDTLQAIEAAQRAIDAIKAAEHDTWLRRIQAGYRKVDPSVFANKEKLAIGSKAQQVVETVPFTAGGVVANAHLALYSLPHVHRDILAAYLDRPTTARRVGSGVWSVMIAAPVMPFQDPEPLGKR